MATRLLSLLTLVERALAGLDAGFLFGQATRIVNYDRGLARLTLPGGRGDILCQHHDLANNDTCVRVALHWKDREDGGETAIYPQGENFDWKSEAERVAQLWITGADGPPELATGGGDADGVGLRKTG